MARGEAPGRKGWELLEQVHDKLGRVETTNAVQVVVVQEMMSRLNSLYDSRRERLESASGDSLHPAVWAVVLLGGFFTMAFCWMFGYERRYLHVISTALVGATLGLIIFLIVSFDFPFRGEIQIAPDSFDQVKTNMEHLSAMLEAD